MKRLLVVEDDARIRDELCVLLRRNGYEASALEQFDDIAAYIIKDAPDLVLLDLNLPGVDGQFVCRTVRQTSSVPIIVVTSRDNDMDELLALSFGADDFIAKPYNDQVLLAHVASVLKRSYGEDASATQITHGALTLDMARCQVSVHDGSADGDCSAAHGHSAAHSGAIGCKSSAELTKNELRILALLMRNAGTVVSRQRIQEELWASDEFVDDNTLSVNISHLRQTLASIGVEEFIHTKRGIGYFVE